MTADPHEPFARYRAGLWVAVVGDGALVLLEQGSGPVLVEQVRGALRDGATSVLQVLARHAPGGLADLPPFALVTRIDGAVHVVVRGPRVRVDVLGAGGTQRVTGEDAATWVEQSFDGADEVVVGVERSPTTAVDASGPDPWWPIGLGVVLVHEVRSTLVEPPWAAGSTTSLGLGARDDLLAETVVKPSAVVEADAVQIDESDAVQVNDPEAVQMGVPDSVDVTILPPEDPPAEVDVLGETVTSATTGDELEALQPAAVTASTEAAEGPEATDGQADDAADEEYDYLWGSTVLHPVEVAAVREPEVEDDAHEAPAPGPGPDTSDDAAAPADLAQPADPDPADPQRAAGAPGAPAAPWSPPFTIDASLTGAGSLGTVRFSTGPVLDLDRPVVVGRKPRVSRVAGGAVPHLVTVPSPANDISRSHLEVRIEDTHVLVVDLGSTNGSTLLRPGREPQRLHPNEAVLVLSGDVVDLGEDVTLTFEGIA